MRLTEFDEEKYEQVVKDDAIRDYTFSLVERGLLTSEEGAKELKISLSDFERAMRESVLEPV